MRSDSQTSQLSVFGHERVLTFLPLWVDFDAFDRAHDLALRLIVMAHTLCACHRVNYIKLISHRDGVVGALRFTDVAVDAFICNSECHSDPSGDRALADFLSIRPALLASLRGFGLKPALN